MNKGIDYYPEHWDQNLIEEDLLRFKSWGINTIRIGEFAWHLIEQEEGKFNFSYFDNIIAIAKKYKLNVMYGVPTATFPAWLNKKYDDILIKQERDISYGGRREYCYNSHSYKAAALKMTEKLVTHYRNEQAIISWQIDNEVGHESSDFCICKNCQRDYRVFLKEKYGNIDKLNETWGTIFWGHTYNNFDEIFIPSHTITYFNPSQTLDFYRFRSISASNFINAIVDKTRECCGKNQSITHDFPGGPFGKIYDHNLIAKNIDYVSYNNYPVWGDLVKPLPPGEIAIQLDFMRGLKEKNFTITEQLIGAQGHRYIGYLPRPNQSYLWCMQALSRGCDNLFYFRERSMNKGQEQFCYGILGHDNKDNNRVLEVKKLLTETKNIMNIINSDFHSKIALVYDFDNVFSWSIQPQSKKYDFAAEFQKMYNAFFKLNVNIDVIDISKDLSKYDVVVLPNMQMINQELKERLEALTMQGTDIVFSYRSGIRDKDNNLHFGLTAPCLVSEMVGAEVLEVESLAGDDLIEITNGNNTYPITVWRDMLEPSTAESLYKYIDDFSNYSCVTKNKYNNSDIYYVGSSLTEEPLEEIAKSILDKKDIKYFPSVENVEVIQRDNMLIILNHNDHEVEFNKEKLPKYSVTIR